MSRLYIIPLVYQWHIIQYNASILSHIKNANFCYLTACIMLHLPKISTQYIIIGWLAAMTLRTCSAASPLWDDRHRPHECPVKYYIRLCPCSIFIRINSKHYITKKLFLPPAVWLCMQSSQNHCTIHVLHCFFFIIRRYFIFYANWIDGSMTTLRISDCDNNWYCAWLEPSRKDLLIPDSWR